MTPIILGPLVKFLAVLEFKPTLGFAIGEAVLGSVICTRLESPAPAQTATIAASSSASRTLKDGRPFTPLLLVGCHGDRRDIEDFFRWEIDHARRLEAAGKLEVVIVAHGTKNVEDLICGHTKQKEAREKILQSLEM